MIEPIKGYEGLYEIDDKGNVYSCFTTKTRRKGALKQEIKNGYKSVNLYKNQTCKHCYVHRLVAEAFLPNENDYNYINHIDCNKLNNSVENLEWCSQKQNIQHSLENYLQNQYKTFVNGIEYLSMKEASLKHFNNVWKIKELRYKYGNQFVYDGFKIKVEVM